MHSMCFTLLHLVFSFILLIIIFNCFISGFSFEGIAESAQRRSSSPPPPPPAVPPSLSKPGHIYYRDLSGKLKQVSMKCQKEINNF